MNHFRILGKSFLFKNVVIILGDFIDRYVAWIDKPGTNFCEFLSFSVRYFFKISNEQNLVDRHLIGQSVLDLFLRFHSMH